jgi:hypothetical protein
MALRLTTALPRIAELDAPRPGGQNANSVILQLSGPKVGAEVSAAVGGVTIMMQLQREPRFAAPDWSPRFEEDRKVAR